MIRDVTAIGAILLILLVALTVGPFIMICGINWILEAGNYPELPYNLKSWFGAFLILIIAKAGLKRE